MSDVAEPRRVEVVSQEVSAGCELHVVYESGPNGYNLYDRLVELRDEYEGGAIYPYIAPPAQVPKAPGRKRMKTDKRDSAALIQAFETRSFRPVVVPDRASREERELVRTREQMMRMRTQLKNKIHGFAKFHGIEVPQRGTKWCGRWISRLKKKRVVRTVLSAPRELISLLISIPHGKGKREGYIFEYKRCRKRFKTALLNSEISTDFRFHDLRHTSASWSLKSGENIEAIRRMLGHADIKTTMQYLHVEDNELNQISEKKFKGLM